MSKKSKLGMFVAGAAIGAGLGVLFAPRSGKETRKMLKDKMDELVEKARQITKEDVKICYIENGKKKTLRFNIRTGKSNLKNIL